MGLTYIDLRIIFSCVLYQLFRIRTDDARLVNESLFWAYCSNGFAGLKRFVSLIHSDSSLTHWITCSGFSHWNSIGIIYTTGNKKSTDWGGYLPLVENKTSKCLLWFVNDKAGLYCVCSLWMLFTSGKDNLYPFTSKSVLKITIEIPFLDGGYW